MSYKDMIDFNNRPINMFYICQLVLDKLWEEYRPKKTKIQFINEVDEEYKKLSGDYGNNDVNNDYSALLTQAAYVKAAVTIHADIFRKVLKNDVLSSFGKEFSLVSIGSGPGTEMLGLIMFLLEMKSKSTQETIIQCYLYDANQNWEKIIRCFEEAVLSLPTVKTALKNQELKIEPATFKILNLLEEFNSDNPGFRTGDLFSFSYLFSELIKLSEEDRLKVEKYILNIFKTAKSGALFMFIDQTTETGSKEKIWIQSIVDKSDCTTRIGQELLNSIFYQLGPFDEEKTLLGDYLGNRSPRLSTNSFSICYKKT